MKINEKIDKFLKSKNKEFEITRKLVNKDFAIRFGVTCSLIIILIMNLFIEYLTKMPNLISGGDKPSLIGILNFSYILKCSAIYIFTLTIFLLAYIKFVLDIKKSFNEIEDGQKGTAKFTTREEIENQYKAVPLTEHEYEGNGGIPIAHGCYEYIDNYGNTHKEDVMYIDDSPVNNLIIGTTRSGKGETFVVPTIDIYSRSKNKPSMIINDPKGELVAMSKETLENRGYEVLILNLINPINSMSYNPLQLIIQAYKNKDFGEAQLLCQTLTYSIYHDPNTKDAFWQNTAMSLTNALILALCEEYIPQNKEEKITMYTVANMLAELGTVSIDFNGVEKYPIDEYFDKLPITSVAKLQYATTQFAKSNTKGSILVSAMNKLSMFTFENIAKMTSKNSLNLKDIGFKNNENDKPKAIFMVTPDYDKSIHVISSIFVRQVYYVLSKNATLSKNGKCDNEVIYLLDEFGNMPPIEGMANIITVCLGRGIRFNLIIQAYNQLKTLYGDDAPTIEGNCGNQIYILTNDDETAEKFSKLIGEKTIITQSRSGEMYTLTKNHTESLDTRRLLKSDELRKLQKGEMIVVRVIKRSDKLGKDITPNPIFNSGKHRMRYRYEYLSKDFDSSKSFIEINVNSLHENIDCKKLGYSYKDEEEIKEIKKKKSEENNQKLNDIKKQMKNTSTKDEVIENKQTEDTSTKDEVTENKNIEDTSTKDEVAENKNIENTSTKDEVTENKNIENTSTKDKVTENKNIALANDTKNMILKYLKKLNVNIDESEEEFILNAENIYEIYSELDEDIVEVIKCYLPR